MSPNWSQHHLETISVALRTLVSSFSALQLTISFPSLACPNMSPLFTRVLQSFQSIALHLVLAAMSWKRKGWKLQAPQADGNLQTSLEGKTPVAEGYRPSLSRAQP